MMPDMACSKGVVSAQALEHVFGGAAGYPALVLVFRTHLTPMLLYYVTLLHVHIQTHMHVNIQAYVRT